MRDCVQAYYLLMMEDQLKNVVYNVCGTNVHKMSYFTDLLIKESGLKGVVKKVYPPFYRPVDIQIQVGYICRLTTDVEWKPEISIEQTMKDLLSYWVEKLSREGE